MAARLAASPSGTVTSVFGAADEREGAFRLLANPNVAAASVMRSVSRSTFEAYPRGRAYCAIDGSSVSVVDRSMCREVGQVGVWSSGGRGLQALTALVCTEDGVPVGLGGVRFWARDKPTRRRAKAFRSLTTETAHTVALLDEIEAARKAHAPDLDLHLVLDRGFDAWPVFRLARDKALHLTVRSSSDRRLVTPRRQRQRRLYAAVRRAPVLGDVLLEVPERNGRAGRLAVLRVRAVRVQIVLQVARKRREHVDITAVDIREVGYRCASPLHWLLLTTDRVTTLDEAQRVADGYALRWRIEELHRAWKTGWCNVERTQLRRRSALIKWATLHLAVAARAVRLSYLARTKPDVPSSDEFSRDEIDATVLFTKRTKYKRGDTPPLGDLVTMIANLGGYTGKSSGGPPGPTVIGRGLERIAIAAETLRLTAQK